MYVGRGMEVTPVDRRSQCDGMYMMELMFVKGIPTIKLLYKEAKHIHLFAFHKSHIPDRMNEESERKLRYLRSGPVC